MRMLSGASLIYASLMLGYAAADAAQTRPSAVPNTSQFGWPTKSLTSFQKKSNVAACNDKPGSAMWFVKLNGPGSAKVTYGVKVDGKPTDKTETARLVDMPGLAEKQLFCSKSGTSTFEPFLISEAAN